MQTTGPLEFLERMFGSATEVQKKSIAPITQKKNVLISAPTGSGKTEAALVPAAFLLIGKPKGIKLIYITPLRSLNRDMFQRFGFLKELGLSYAVRHGDTPQVERARQMRELPDILITTPETFQSLLVRKGLDLSSVEFVIIDEIHELVGSKRGVQLSLSLERLAQACTFTRIGISATISDLQGMLSFLCGKEREGVIVSSSSERQHKIKTIEPMPLDKIADSVAELSKTEKLIVFTNTRELAELFSSKLKQRIECVVHHGSLARAVREEAENSFKTGKLRCIVSTSSLEMGIDIGDVSLVVQLGSPKRVEKLIQRIGRSNHSLDGVATGILYSLSHEDLAEAKAIIEQLGKGYSQPILKNSYDVVAQQAIGVLLSASGPVDIHEIHKILSGAYCYDLQLTELAEILYELSKNGLLYYDLRSGLAHFRSAGRFSYLGNLSFIPSQERYELLNSLTNRKIAFLDTLFVSKLDKDDVFISKGQAWKCIDIDDEKKLVSVIPENVAIAVPEWLGEDIPVETGIAQRVAELMDEQQFFLEWSEESGLLVAYTHLGSKKNRAVELALRLALKELGYPIITISDAYRIIVHDYSAMLSPEKLVKAIGTLTIGDSVAKSRQYHNAVLQAMLHFGAVEKIGSGISHEYTSRLSETVYGREAIAYCMHRNFDPSGFELVRGKQFQVRTLTARTLGYLQMTGIMRSDQNVDVLQSLKDSLLDRNVELRCTFCGTKARLKVKFLDEKILCAKCGSPLVELNGAKGSEALVHAYGKRAALALVAYGVSTSTAKRILKNIRRDERYFLWDILQAQLNFIRTRKYWDV